MALFVAYNFNQSLRQSCTGSPKGLLRALGTPSSQKIFTFSFWFRFESAPNPSIDAYLFTYFMNTVGSCSIAAADTEGDGAFHLYFEDYDGTNDYIYRGSTDFVVSGDLNWHHVLVQIDTTQAVELNRVKMWLDGTAETVSESAQTSGAMPQNTILQIQSGGSCDVAPQAVASGVGTLLVDEVACFDGQTVSVASVMSGGHPLSLTGLTFGNNGFWLRFDNILLDSNIGLDSSGKGNNMTNGGTDARGFTTGPFTRSADLSNSHPS